MRSLPLLYNFDERRVLLDQAIVARTGFWLSFFRFQGATTHATDIGGAFHTVSGSPSTLTDYPVRDAHPTSARLHDASR